MDTKIAKAFALMLLQMLESVETENEVLRVALERRGEHHSKLQAELNELRESAEIKQRIQATIAPTKKRIEAIFGEIASKETLAALPVKDDKLQ